MIQKINQNVKQVLGGFIFATMLFAAAGCANRADKRTETPADDTGTRDDAIIVHKITAFSENVPQVETYASTIQAYATNNIAPLAVSRIQKINVEVGDFVSKGQILAEMDKVQLNQARLKLTKDSTEFGRIKGLYQEGGIAKSDFETMELSLKVSKSSYENLYENTILRSPISGVITARNYDKGDLFSMGRPIYVVQQISPVKILVGVSETDYTKIKKGDKVSVTTDAVPGKDFLGSINRIYPTIDAASHTFLTEITIPNSDRFLRPGMYAKVKITFGINHSVVVPDEAVVKMQGAGQRMVYIIQPDGTVKSSPVTIGKHFETYYEILDGVSEGDEIVTQGSSSLKNGSRIKVVNN